MFCEKLIKFTYTLTGWGINNAILFHWSHIFPTGYFLNMLNVKQNNSSKIPQNKKKAHL